MFWGVGDRSNRRICILSRTRAFQGQFLIGFCEVRVDCAASQAEEAY